MTKGAHYYLVKERRRVRRINKELQGSFPQKDNDEFYLEDFQEEYTKEIKPVPNRRTDEGMD